MPGSRNSEVSARGISADGRFVMFETFGALVPEDTSDCAIPRAGRPCRTSSSTIGQTSATTMVSVSAPDVQVEQACSIAVDISADGRFVLFSRRRRTSFRTKPTAARSVSARSADRNDDARQSRYGGQSVRTRLQHVVPGRMSADGRIIIYSPAFGSESALRLPFYLYERETGMCRSCRTRFPPRTCNRRAFDLLSSRHQRRRAPRRRVPDTPGGGAAAAIPMRFLFHDRLTGHTGAGGWQVSSMVGNVTVRRHVRRWPDLCDGGFARRRA